MAEGLETLIFILSFTCIMVSACCVVYICKSARKAIQGIVKEIVDAAEQDSD